MPSCSIVIPCFNEGARLATKTFIDFANNYRNVHLVFVNDGSTDNTLTLLEEIKKETGNVAIIDRKKNGGKACAIRDGFLFTTSLPTELTGYLDADLSTSLEEFYLLALLASREKADFILGSRIKKIDTRIERSALRHIVGRVIATIIDQKFKLGAYDTQCGAKVFRSEVIKGVIAEKFVTKWFVDVELLVRLRKVNGQLSGAEIPLRSWINKKDSKISILSIPIIVKDLFYLLKLKD